MDINIRDAEHSDIRDIKTILSYYFFDTENVEKNISEWKVAVFDERVIGCASLGKGDVVELKFIAILPEYRNKGIGSQLVNSLLTSVAHITDTVYVRTTSPGFFEKKGFQKLDHYQKKIIWKDCAKCEKFHSCTQVLMKIQLQSFFYYND